LSVTHNKLARARRGVPNKYASVRIYTIASIVRTRLITVNPNFASALTERLVLGDNGLCMRGRLGAILSRSRMFMVWENSIRTYRRLGVIFWNTESDKDSILAKSSRISISKNTPSKIQNAID